MCQLLQALRVGAWPRPTLPALPRPQVVSSILRNLSWRADINSKKVLREVGSMTALMQCVLRATKVGIGWVAEGRGSQGSQEAPPPRGKPSQTTHCLVMGPHLGLPTLPLREPVMADSITC